MGFGLINIFIIGAETRRLKCHLCGSSGGQPESITMENIKLPSVVIFGFLAGFRCQQSINCLVKETLRSDEINLRLVGAVVAKPNHFLAVTKLGDKFYNMDNLDKSSGKVGYFTFKEAFINKATPDRKDVNIGKRSSDCQRAGAIMNLVYIGDKEHIGSKFAEHRASSGNLNETLMGGSCLILNTSSELRSSATVSPPAVTFPHSLQTPSKHCSGPQAPLLSPPPSEGMSSPLPAGLSQHSQAPEPEGPCHEPTSSLPKAFPIPPSSQANPCSDRLLSSKDYCEAPQVESCNSGAFHRFPCSPAGDIDVKKFSSVQSQNRLSSSADHCHDPLCPPAGHPHDMKKFQSGHSSDQLSLPAIVCEDLMPSEDIDEPKPISQMSCQSSSSSPKQNEEKGYDERFALSAEVSPGSVSSQISSDEDLSPGLDVSVGVSTDIGDKYIEDDVDVSMESKIKDMDDSTAKIDLRLKTFQDLGKLYRLYPGSYFNHDKCGWFCRKCQSYALPSSFSNPWISSGVQLGDHPTRKLKSHFESELHRKSLDAEIAFRKPSVYSLILEHGAQSKLKEEVINRNAVKSMFVIVNYMVKHRLPNVSYEDMVHLIADAGSSEMKQFLESCPKNALYTSHTTFLEILKTMNEYIEKPFLENLRKSFYTIFLDETTAVGNISVANVYVMFEENGHIKEHYLGIIDMNRGLGLTAMHFHQALSQLAEKKDIDLKNCVFSELDGCPTNQGNRKGLRLYFSFYNPHHKSESCLSHKAALLPQHLVVEGEYSALSKADSLVVAIALYFKSSSLRSAVFENTQLVLEVKSLKLFLPSPTRWLSHGKSFARFLERFTSVLVSLNSIYVDKEDYAALGHLMSLLEPEFHLSCLALHDIFLVLNPLTLWLQTAPSSIDITMVNANVSIAVNKLKYLAGESNYKKFLSERELESLKFSLQEFRSLSSEVEEFLISTPAANHTRSRRQYQDNQQQFDEFKENIFIPFALDMAKNLSSNLEIDPVCRAFQCLDARNFPASNLENFGKEDLKLLAFWYGRSRRGSFPNDDSQSFVAPPVVETTVLEGEYELYKATVKDLKAVKSKNKQREIDEIERQISNIRKNKNSRRELKRVNKLENKLRELQCEEFSLKEAYKLLKENGMESSIPNVLKLLLLANLCPVGNAIVERLFSLLKITKTFLRSSLSNENLDILLRLNKEAPEKLSENDKDALLELFLKRKGEKVSRLKL